MKLAENIRSFRKERKLTQEQLAEALGVTAGAVHKWERSLSVPDISLILEMADLFDTSTDVLLGYVWRTGGADAAAGRIRELIRMQQFEEAVAEAERVLKKYPNRFDIVYQSALAYLGMSSTFDMSGSAVEHHRRVHDRGIELFEHACALLPQNTDDSVNEVTIRRNMASLHANCMYIYRAIDVLKHSNVCGVNNALIGMLYGDTLHDTEQAEKYLGKAFGTLMDDMDAVIVGYLNVFFQRKDYDSAIDCVHWLRRTLRGIQPEEELTAFDRYDCVLLEIIAECCCFKGDYENARRYIRQALEKALRYDAAGADGIRPMRLYAAMRIEQQPTYGVRGETALMCLENRFAPDDEVPGCWKLWLEVKREVLQSETV